MVICYPNRLMRDGVLGATEWDAGTVLTAKAPTSRKIITYSRDTGDGIPFTWSAIDGLSDSTQKDFLTKMHLALVIATEKTG